MPCFFDIHTKIALFWKEMEWMVGQRGGGGDGCQGENEGESEVALLIMIILILMLILILKKERGLF